MNRFKKSIHDLLVRILTKRKDGLDKKHVNTKYRTIDLGLYGFNKLFLSPVSEYSGYLLVRWFGYKCFEQRIGFVGNL